MDGRAVGLDAHLKAEVMGIFAGKPLGYLVATSKLWIVPEDLVSYFILALVRSRHLGRGLGGSDGRGLNLKREWLGLVKDVKKKPVLTVCRFFSLMLASCCRSKLAADLIY